MKVAALSLCILTGVVDTKNDDIVVLEVSSYNQNEIEYIAVRNEALPTDIKEGEKITITVFTDDDLQKYCQSPL